jgi:integrase
MHFFLVFACFVPTLDGMATLYKKKNSPFYYAQYFDGNGDRVSRSTSTSSKREATRIAERFEAESRDDRAKAAQLPKAFAVVLEQVTRDAAAGQLTLARAEEFVKRLHKLANPRFEEKTLAQYWQTWVDEQTRHVSISTANGYQQDLDLFAEALGQRIMTAPIQQLAKQQIDGAIEKLRNDGKRKASTINKALAALRRVLESALADGVVTHNAAKTCRTLSAVDSTKRAPFTLEEIRALIDHKQTSDEWKGAIIIGAQTGLRLSDVLSLSDENIDGTRLVIVPAKSARTQKVITVPLTPACIGWIADKKGEFFPTLKAQKKGTTSTQFIRIMQKSSVSKEIKLHGGIIAERTFHSLRHTFASWLAEADIHADVRQKLTGHSSSKIHQRYTHHDEALDRAVATLPSL